MTLLVFKVRTINYKSFLKLIVHLLESQNAFFGIAESIVVTYYWISATSPKRGPFSEIFDKEARKHKFRRIWRVFKNDPLAFSEKVADVDRSVRTNVVVDKIPLHFGTSLSEPVQCVAAAVSKLLHVIPR